MKGLYRTIGWLAAAMFLLFGTCSCDRKEAPKPSYQAEEVSCEAPESNIPPKKAPDYQVEEVNENEYRVFVGDPAPRLELSSSPKSKAGIEAEIFASVTDSGKNAGIRKFVVYEDGKPIHSSTPNGNYDWENIEVKHTQEGEHTYSAVAVDKSGNRARSGAITLRFSGKPLDLPPTIGFDICGHRNAAYFDIAVDDEGDNRGIEKIDIFEDGALIKTSPEYGNCRFIVSIPLVERGVGRHNYFAEVVDKGGNVTRSKTLTLEFVE